MLGRRAKAKNQIAPNVQMVKQIQQPAQHVGHEGISLHDRYTVDDPSTPSYSELQSLKPLGRAESNKDQKSDNSKTDLNLPIVSAPNSRHQTPRDNQAKLKRSRLKPGISVSQDIVSVDESQEQEVLIDRIDSDKLSK